MSGVHSGGAEGRRRPAAAILRIKVCSHPKHTGAFGQYSLDFDLHFC
jgi:hypothetical protein